MLNGANFLGAIGGSLLLGFFGRKSLFLSTQLSCIVFLAGMWVFSDALVDSDIGIEILAVAFIFAFEFGPGPIVWLYISEICNDKATSVNTVVNWIWTLFMSIMTLYLSQWLKGYLWLLFGATSTVGFIYLTLFMKETKGLSKD